MQKPIQKRVEKRKGNASGRIRLRCKVTNLMINRISYFQEANNQIGPNLQQLLLRERQIYSILIIEICYQNSEELYSRMIINYKLRYSD
jgi:hypothetical protein